MSPAELHQKKGLYVGGVVEVVGYGAVERAELQDIALVSHKGTASIKLWGVYLVERIGPDDWKQTHHDTKQPFLEWDLRYVYLQQMETGSRVRMSSKGGARKAYCIFFPQGDIDQKDTHSLLKRKNEK